MSDILFVKTSSFGDLVHQMPALSEARRHGPGGRFCWVVEEPFAPLVRLHPAVDEVILAPSRRWRRALHLPSTMREVRDLLRVLRARHFEAIIDTQGLLRSALIAHFARGRSHGFDSKYIREPIASWFYNERHSVSRDLHAVVRNRMLTGMALGYAPEGEPDFGLNRAALAAPADAPYAVLLHGTSRAGKEWPVERWIALGQALSGRKLTLVLPWGNATEQDRANRIAASVPNADVPAWRPLSEMIHVIAGASLVIGVDTGLMQLAGALGVPSVAVFVATTPGLTSPVGPGKIEVIGGKQIGVPTVADVLSAVERVC
ncbi:MAG: lipopolysaccharide heptosyltransferase I [Xanthobacteraceae bacterium]